MNLRAHETAEAALKCFLSKRQPEFTKPESHYIRFGISERALCQEKNKRARDKKSQLLWVIGKNPANFGSTQPYWNKGIKGIQT